MFRRVTITTLLRSRRKFVDMRAVWEFFVSVTDILDVLAATMKVVGVTFLAKEFSVTQVTKRRFLREMARTQWAFSFCEPCKDLGFKFTFTSRSPS